MRLMMTKGGRAGKHGRRSGSALSEGLGFTLDDDCALRLLSLNYPLFGGGLRRSESSVFREGVVARLASFLRGYVPPSTNWTGIYP